MYFPLEIQGAYTGSLQSEENGGGERLYNLTMRQRELARPLHQGPCSFLGLLRFSPPYLTVELGSPKQLTLGTRSVDNRDNRALITPNSSTFTVCAQHTHAHTHRHILYTHILTYYYTQQACHTHTQDKDGLVHADSLKPVPLTQTHGAAHEYVPADTRSIPNTIMDHSDSKPHALCLCLLKL